ncbi:hypothetical protein CHUAL_004568 [Chamberlinius hualienensis]
MNQKISMPYEDVFELIEWYRARPPLWNGNSLDKLGKKEYKASITDLVINFQSRGKYYTAELLREKFANLKKIFNREFRRVLASVSEGAEKVYSPKWIYYDRLLFLKDTFQYSAETQNILESLSHRDFKRDQHHEEDGYTTPLTGNILNEDGNISPIPSIAVSVSSPESPGMASTSDHCAAGVNGMVKEEEINGSAVHPAKRRKVADDKLSDLISFLKDWQQQNKKQRRDEVDAFTDYIGNKLRRLPEGLRAHVEMEIHQLIYQAITNHTNESG